MKERGWVIALFSGLGLFAINRMMRKASWGVQLAAGENVVAYGGPTMPVEQAVASIAGSLESVWYWDGTTWWVYTPVPSYDDLVELVKGQTYNLFMLEPAMWQISY